MVTIPLLCLIAALALSGYEVVSSRAKSLLGWAVFLLAVAMIWSRLALR
jgi:hypothetical protein